MDNFDDLDALLKQWDEEPPLNENLKNKVWMRVASANSQQTFFKRILTQIELAFRKPLVAAAFLGICVAFGLLIGDLRVNQIKQDHMAVLAQQYINLIEPTNDLSTKGVQK